MALLKGNIPLDAKLKKIQEEIHQQARNHMSRDGLSHFLKELRPNEDASINKYRIKNTRRLSRDGVNSYYALFSRLFTNSGIKISQISQKLDDYIKTKPFKCNNKRMNLFTWFYSSPMWDCGVDPNGVFVVWPEKDKGSYINKELPVRPQTKFFNWSQVKGTVKYQSTISGQVEDWYYYAIQTAKDLMQSNDGGLHEHWLVNQTKIAVYRDEIISSKVETILVWEYEHNMNDYPILGTVSFTTDLENGQKINESILSDFFEFADEFMSRFSDAQGIAIMHDFPIRMMLANILGLKCKNKTCSANKSERVGATVCPDCKGSGWDLSKLGVYSTLIYEGNSVLEKGTTVAPITYAQPDTGNINNSFDKGFELFEMGKKAIGLDLIGAASESGVARELRFEEIQDKLGWLALNCKMWLERLLWLYESYLVINEGERVEPIIFVPKTLKLKNAEILLQEAVAALPVDRYNAQMSYIEEKYQDDSNKVRACKMALKYCPELQLNETEFNTFALNYNLDSFIAYRRLVITPIIYDIVIEKEEKSDRDIIALALEEVSLMWQMIQPKAPEKIITASINA